MKRQLHNVRGAFRISAVLLVLAMTLALGVSLGLSAVGAGTDTLDLTVTLADKSQITGYELIWNYLDVESGVIKKGTEVTAEETATGFIFRGIRKDAKVWLHFTTEIGVQLQDPGTGNLYRDTEKGDYYYWDFFGQDAGDTALSPVLEAAKYEIVFLDMDRVGERSYADMVEQPFDYSLSAPVQYTYGEGTTRLPALNDKNGKNFQDQWNVIAQDNDSAAVIYRVTAGEDGKFYLPTEIRNETVHKNKRLYVYPVILGLDQPVRREDHVMVDGVKLDREPLGGNDTAWTLPAYSEFVTGLYKDPGEVTGGYKQYPGFRLLENAEAYKLYAKRISEATAENPNVVLRFYEPLSYNLSYENVESAYLALAVKKYQYSMEATIPDPERTGYVFLGWEVDVTLGGKTVTYPYAQVEREFISADGKIAEGLHAAYASEDEERTIVLRAVWAAKKYAITYDLTGITVDADVDYNTNTLPAFYTYGSSENGIPYFSIPAPKRSGYTFMGWMITAKNASGETVETDYTMSQSHAAALYGEDGSFSWMTAPPYPSEIFLRPVWRANRYAVILDGNDAATVSSVSMGSTSVKEQEFDTYFNYTSRIVLPLAEGYVFDGYWSSPTGGKQYIDPNGYPAREDDGNGGTVSTRWTEFETNENGEVVLYAHWQVCYYDVTVGFTDKDIPAGVSRDEVQVYLSYKNVGSETWSDPELLGEAGESLAYGTELRVRIVCPDGYKTVRLGKMTDAILPIVSHANPYENAEAMVVKGKLPLRAMILPMIEPIDPNVLDVDYINETLSGFPDGDYRLVLGDVKVEVSVSNGKIRVNGQVVSGAVDIPNAFFGQTVELYRCGDSITWADSAPGEMTFAARPAAPSSEWFDADVSHEDRLHVITESFPIDLDPSKFEFAVSYLSDPMLLSRSLWQSEHENLMQTGTLKSDIVRPGTAYYLFARVKATESAPHGEACVILVGPTAYAKYRNNVMATLSEILNTPGCGDNLKKLVNATRIAVDTAINRVETGLANGTVALESVSIWRDVEAILADFEAKRPLAELKDERLAQLSAFVLAAHESGRYTKANLTRVDNCYATYLNLISGATDETGVNLFYAQADEELRAIPVHVFYDETETVKLESQIGLPYAGILTLSRHENLDAILAAIRDAINAGRILPPEGMEQDEAKALLSELDPIAYYAFSLENATVKRGDYLRITLTLPEELRSHTGLRVAYFDPESGELCLLDSNEFEKDGDALIFYADRVADFVILADANVSLGGVLIALIVLVLAQLTVLAFLLLDFFKRRRGTTRAVFALPTVALVIRFSPVGALAAVWILGILALLLQAAIVLLILYGRVARLSRTPHKADKDVPVADGEATEEELEEELDEELEEDFEEDLDEEELDEEELDEEDVYAYSEMANGNVVYLDEEGYGEEADENASDENSEADVAQDDAQGESLDEDDDGYGYDE